MRMTPMIPSAFPCCTLKKSSPCFRIYSFGMVHLRSPVSHKDDYESWFFRLSGSLWWSVFIGMSILLLFISSPAPELWCHYYFYSQKSNLNTFLLFTLTVSYLSSWWRGCQYRNIRTVLVLQKSRNCFPNSHIHIVGIVICSGFHYIKPCFDNGSPLHGEWQKRR